MLESNRVKLTDRGTGEESFMHLADAEARLRDLFADRNPDAVIDALREGMAIRTIGFWYELES